MENTQLTLTRQELYDLSLAAWTQAEEWRRESENPDRAHLLEAARRMEALERTLTNAYMNLPMR